MTRMDKGGVSTRLTARTASLWSATYRIWSTGARIIGIMVGS